MARSCSKLLGLVLSPIFLVSILVANPNAGAQQQRSDTVDGYITSAHPPTGFDVNGEHVITGPATTYGLAADKQTESDSPLRDAVQVGAYVYVTGKAKGKTVLASAVRFRDDWDKKLSGLAVIDKVISKGAEPIYRSDGYYIRITSATKATFQDSLKTMDDVGTNTWMCYEGKRDQGGVLIAATAQFIPAKPVKFKALKGWEVNDMGFQPPRSSLKSEPAPKDISQPPGDVSDEDAVMTEDGKVSWSTWGTQHKVPADQTLQARVRRVGMKLVPAYQRDLPAGHPSRIQFRFYAVDAAKTRTEICSTEGLILIPKQLVERVRNDDQLAALLADGVAFNLQRQSARLVKDSRLLLDTAIAEDIASFFIPGVNLIALAQTEKMSKILAEMEEQRGRVALALMADAGYDPWQAPEAWRLAAPKKLPADLDSLKYPSRSGYQLGILNLQYRDAGAAGGVKSQ